MAEGEVETEDGVLVLRRIHVTFTLRGATPDQVEAAQRVHGVFKSKCPVYRSIHTSIDVTTALDVAS